jgi:hypothetical protein
VAVSHGVAELELCAAGEPVAVAVKAAVGFCVAPSDTDDEAEEDMVAVPLSVETAVDVPDLLAAAVGVAVAVGAMIAAALFEQPEGVTPKYGPLFTKK